MSWLAWVALVAVAGTLVARVVRARSRPNLDVGAVSDQWIAEHRAGWNDSSV
jgi:hypothetical protein